MAPLVDNPQIKSAELLRPLPLQRHAYVWPFAIIWPVFLRFYLSSELYEKYINAPEWTFVWVGTIITVQSLVWLCTHWSVNLRAAFTAKRARSIDDAELIKVIPIANAGSADICKLVRDKVIPPFPSPDVPPRRVPANPVSPSQRPETAPTSRSCSRSADSSTTPKLRPSVP